MKSRIFLVLLVFLILVDHSVGRRRTGNRCRRRMTMCRTIRRCVPDSKFCDGVSDCADHSDEYTCPGFECPRGRFHCGDGPCINPSWRCDGYDDCTDGSDEANCPA